MPSYVSRAPDPEARPYVDLTSPSRSPSPVPLVTPAITAARQLSGAGSSAQPYIFNSPGASISHNHQQQQNVLKPKHPNPQNQQRQQPQVGKAQTQSHGSSGFASFIKPSTPGAFKQKTQPSGGARPAQPQFGAVRPQAGSSGSARPPQGLQGQFPLWVTQGRPNPSLNIPTNKPSSAPQRASAPSTAAAPPQDDPEAERFDLNAVPFQASDYDRVASTDADAHMRELLSGAVGDGEQEQEDGAGEGEDEIEGFASGIRLMPHQVRGVRWMRQRESGKKYGGILADDMGLGKTVQTLARIVEGVATAAEKKAGYKAGTLIVAPLAVMEQWAQECLSKTTPGTLKVTTHHGPGRTKSAKVLEKFDVVITTFQTLASEHGAFETSRQSILDASDSDSGSDSDGQRIGKTVAKTKPKPKAKKAAPSALFEVKWLRVVIDEAQHIKNRTTKAAKAAVALKAKYRWCLTGTPIQNNVEELFSLFQFLRAKPLDDWQTFRERISSLVKEGKTKLAMKRLHIVLKAIMLRRMKDAVIDGKPILNLPARLVNVVKCDFDSEERAFYDALEQKTTLTFNKYLKNGSAMSNYTSVLTMLLRMRQACDHPSLVAHSLSEDKDALESKPAPSEDKDEADDLANLFGGLGVANGAKCEVCFIQLSDPSAKHCDECAALARRARERSAAEATDGLPPSSAKIRMLLKLIKETDQKSGGKEKTIVFSQFTSFLNLIEPFLKRHGIAYVRYDGSMRNDKRQESLEKIKTSKTVNVILISFKAGSTGLNLTCCNNVILMDLWWNPALEDQAFDRAHRLGQKLDVNIHKLTVEETVEDRILTLQNNKRELARAALSGEATKNMKLTMNDIMALFKRSAHHDED